MPLQIKQRFRNIEPSVGEIRTIKNDSKELVTEKTTNIPLSIIKNNGDRGMNSRDARRVKIGYN